MLGFISFALLLPGADAQQSACGVSFGLVSKTGIDLNGNGVSVDSFDSTDASKSSDGQYDTAKRQANGNVTIGESLINSITNVANANIYGVVFISPSGSVAMGPNGSVGPTFVEAQRATTVAQGLANGSIGTNCSLYVPDVSLPVGLSSATSLGTINGGTTLSSGDYQTTSILLTASKKLTIMGNVTLYVTGDISVSGSASIEIVPGGSLWVYAVGNVNIAGNGVVNGSLRASYNQFYGLPTSTSWSITAGTQWDGTVYAPEAALALGAGDKSGAFIAASMMFSGNGNIHYDESLGVKVCSSASGSWVDGITGITLTGSDVCVSFPVASLRHYTVEYIDDLTASNWTGLAATNTSSCTGEMVRVIDPGGSSRSQRFYRLKIQPESFGF